MYVYAYMMCVWYTSMFMCAVKGSLCGLLWLRTMFEVILDVVCAFDLLVPLSLWRIASALSCSLSVSLGILQKLACISE